MSERKTENCNICQRRPVCFPHKVAKSHRHRWSLLPGDRGDASTKRHCFGCNTTHVLETATKWSKCDTAIFGIDPKEFDCDGVKPSL